MSAVPVLIIADSRGRYLEHYIENTFIHLNAKIIWKGGLSLHNTFSFAREAVLLYRPNLIYVLTGLCDLTYLRSIEPRQVALRYESIQGTVYSYMTKVDLVHSQLYSLRRLTGVDPMIVFPTQTGMDMGVYSGFPDDLVHPHQHVLDNALVLINKHITTMNRSMRITTPFLASQIHSRCRGKVRNMYSKLPDGCHLSPFLRQIWATKLYENSLINFQKYDTYVLTNHVVSGI